jgi:imidazolonepropionase
LCIEAFFDVQIVIIKSKNHHITKLDSMLIRNIQQLFLTDNQITAPLRGDDLRQVNCLENAYLLVEDGRIAAFGPMAEAPERAERIIDAAGGAVLPTWCDSHTHLVFAAPREQEFVYRIQGLSYHEIAEKGGGILNSARKLQAMEEEELLASAYERLQEVIKTGTGAIEIKSGYGLTYEAELKMLRVIQRLKDLTEIPIKATFLGAHALPAEYKEKREAYLDLVLNKMLPDIADQGLADYIDVFCEKGFYSVEETERILEAGAKYGLKGKIHTNQFNCMGGIQAAIKHGALSVDHLEVLNEEEMAALRDSDTIATLLPTAPFFLNDDHRTPARALIESGAAVALATDFNPGTTPSGRMPFVVSLACIQLRMLPEEAINAATINAAYAMDLGDELGSIKVGKRANFMITKPMPSLAYIPYAFGSDVIKQVVVNGKLV